MLGFEVVGCMLSSYLGRKAGILRHMVILIYRFKFGLSLLCEIIIWKYGLHLFYKPTN